MFAIFVSHILALVFTQRLLESWFGISHFVQTDVLLFCYFPISVPRSDEKVTATNIDPSESPQLTAKPVVFLTPSTICKKTEVETKSPDLLRPSSTLNHINTAPVSSLPVMPKRRRVRLHTVLSMRRRLEQQMDPEARRMLRACKFVGSVDRTCCLVQHETDLLLIRLQPLTRAFFYQLSVTNFANHGEVSASHLGFHYSGAHLRL